MPQPAIWQTQYSQFVLPRISFPLSATKDNLSIQHSPDWMPQGGELFERVRVGENEVGAISRGDSPQFRRLSEIRGIVLGRERQNLGACEAGALEMIQLIVKARTVSDHRGVCADRHFRACAVKFPHGAVAELHQPFPLGGGEFLEAAVRFDLPKCRIDKRMPLDDQST